MISGSIYPKTDDFSEHGGLPAFRDWYPTRKYGNCTNVALEIATHTKPSGDDDRPLLHGMDDLNHLLHQNNNDYLA